MEKDTEHLYEELYKIVNQIFEIKHKNRICSRNFSCTVNGRIYNVDEILNSKCKYRFLPTDGPYAGGLTINFQNF